MTITELHNTLVGALWAFLGGGLATFIALRFRSKDYAAIGEWWREEGYAIWIIAAGIIGMILVALDVLTGV